MCRDKYNHPYFTDKQIDLKVGLGSAEFVDNVFMIKCHGCFELLTADHTKFAKSKGGLSRICKTCYKIHSYNKYRNKIEKGMLEHQLMNG